MTSSAAPRTPWWASWAAVIVWLGALSLGFVALQALGAELTLPRWPLRLFEVIAAAGLIPL
ncbi:MAG: hypothetical protein JXO22_01710, partial [Phycisphaerae bacterium]|nr:hypothetical protein [Phycisphaerae bacterium]